jgi:hypothetical protein
VRLPKASTRIRVVVADTSPINYLVLTDQIGVLPQLYTRILIPPAVLEEWKHPVAAESVQDWAGHPPSWLEGVASKADSALPNSTLDKAGRCSRDGDGAIGRIFLIGVHRR